MTLQLHHGIARGYHPLVDILLDTPNIVQRTQNIGRLEPKVARDYSPVGPNLRGSGFARDIRVIHPYCAYENVPWHTVI